MKYFTDEIIERAIRLQPENIFDSHAIYSTLMTDFARDYVRQLYECLEYDPDPFVKLHTDIAKRMASKDLGHIVRKHGGKRMSLNCRGKEEECQVWERIEGKGTTRAGFINPNQQQNLGPMQPPIEGTDYGQYVYIIQCTCCGLIYGANGSDIWERKCPKCQGGKPGIPLPVN